MLIDLLSASTSTTIPVTLIGSAPSRDDMTSNLRQQKRKGGLPKRKHPWCDGDGDLTGMSEINTSLYTSALSSPGSSMAASDLRASILGVKRSALCRHFPPLSDASRVCRALSPCRACVRDRHAHSLAICAHYSALQRYADLVCICSGILIIVCLRQFSNFRSGLTDVPVNYSIGLYLDVTSLEHIAGMYIPQQEGGSIEFPMINMRESMYFMLCSALSCGETNYVAKSNTVTWQTVDTPTQVVAYHVMLCSLFPSSRASPTRTPQLR